MTERIVSRLMALLPKANVEVLRELTEQCRDEFNQICNLDEAPEAAETVIARMVVWHYNRLGAEGLNSQSYSGMNESYASEYPEPLKRSIYRFRRLRTL